MRYALVRAERFFASDLPAGWRVIKRLDELAVLIDGPDAGPLPRLEGLTEIEPATAAVLLSTSEEQ